MKKVFLPIFILTYVLILSGIWITKPENNSTPSFLEYVFIGILLVFFTISIYLWYRRIKRKKQGFPEDDEMSKKIAQKAAAISYYISLFLWLVLIYLHNKIIIDIQYLFTIGIIGMAVIFVLCWVIFNFKGIKDE